MPETALAEAPKGSSAEDGRLEWSYTDPELIEIDEMRRRLGFTKPEIEPEPDWEEPFTVGGEPWPSAEALVAEKSAKNGQNHQK